MWKGLVLACWLATGVAYAQEWEVGAIGGFGYAPDFTVKGPSGSATTGLKNGPVVGAFGGDDAYDHWSVEARYLYRFSNLKLSSGSTSLDFGAHTHILNADALFHFRPRTSRIRPYLVFGGGIKLLEGTGAASASQPLGNLVALTHTSETLLMADGGAGVKINLRQHVRVRFEIQDYISAAPSKVIFAAPGTSMSGGLWHDIQGIAAISYTW
jgi:hypothetical protein